MTAYMPTPTGQHHMGDHSQGFIQGGVGHGISPIPSPPPSLIELTGANHWNRFIHHHVNMCKAFMFTLPPPQAENPVWNTDSHYLTSAKNESVQILTKPFVK